jgi:DNA polymerase-3 subunit delta'
MSADQETEILAPTPIGHGMSAVVGQTVVLTALHTAIERGRLPHALLFTGPEGVGKATTALLLAQAVNCAAAGPSDACGECPSCSRIARGIHPDVLWVAPDPKIIRIGQITPRPGSPLPPLRTVTQFLGYTPYEGNRRVVVIDGAHAMQAPAQNALLKTLEEPPASALLILVTHAPGVLLPTVLSRCQSLRFARVGQDAVRQYLEERLDQPPEEARLRAALTAGSIGNALTLDLDAYATLLETVVEALRMSQSGGGGVVAAADTLANAGYGETATQRAASVLRVGRDVLRDLLVVAAGAESAGLVNATQREAWVAWAREVDDEGVIAALRALNTGVERFTTGIQPNIKMALEQTLIEVGAGLARAPKRVTS